MSPGHGDAASSGLFTMDMKFWNSTRKIAQPDVAKKMSAPRTAECLTTSLRDQDSALKILILFTFRVSFNESFRNAAVRPIVRFPFASIDKWSHLEKNVDP